MIEPLPFRMVFPQHPGGVQQVHRSDNVGVNELRRVGYRTVDMRFGCQVDNAIGFIPVKYVEDLFLKGNIGLDK